MQNHTIFFFFFLFPPHCFLFCPSLVEEKVPSENRSSNETEQEAKKKIAIILRSSTRERGWVGWD